MNPTNNLVEHYLQKTVHPTHTASQHVYIITTNYNKTAAIPCI